MPQFRYKTQVGDRLIECFSQCGDGCVVIKASTAACNIAKKSCVVLKCALACNLLGQES